MLRRLMLLTLGWFFIALGIVGLFLPVLQGILFLCVGLIILSFEYTWARRLLERLRKRFPLLDRYSIRALQTIALIRTSWQEKRQLRMAVYAGLFMTAASAGALVWVWLSNR